MSEELRLRRAVALAALVIGFLGVLLAVVLAFTGGGGGGGGGTAGERGEATTERRQAPARRRAQAALPAEPAVPASAPGAHKAPDESVPILAYNVINTPRPDTANPEIWVPPEEFRAQMAYLQDNGYHPVTLRQLWAAWKQGGLLPSKPVVITFDTGYHSVYANALPELRRRKWAATLFLDPAQTEADFPGTEVSELIEAGWELGLQGSAVQDLTALGDEELQATVSGARRQLRRQFRRRVEFFSYPGGAYDERVAGAVQAAGFLGAVTLEEGLASPQDPPYELRRIAIANGDGEAGLASKLQSAGGT
jgi:peptidoglycan/xylan/chitin deacetylase (PgdA/CDA1 family)